MRLALVALAAAAALSATPLQAQELSDGTYRCIMPPDFHLGDIEVSGTSYRGPGYNGSYGDEYTFTQMGDKVIWNGPLGAFNSDGTTIDYTEVFPLTAAGGTGFTIAFRSPDSTGGAQRAVCRP